jgi:hypothetical protein
VCVCACVCVSMFRDGKLTPRSAGESCGHEVERDKNTGASRAALHHSVRARRGDGARTHTRTLLWRQLSKSARHKDGALVGSIWFKIDSFMKVGCVCASVCLRRCLCVCMWSRVRVCNSSVCMCACAAALLRYVCDAGQATYAVQDSCD